MLDAGLVEEVQALRARGDLDASLPAMRAVGYRQVRAWLDGEISYEEMLRQAVVATRRYAKRQETWFRHQLLGHPVVTLDATDAPVLLAGRIAELWKDRGT